MRVLHVSAYFAPAFCYGGPPRSILGLCRSLRSQGVDAEVLSTTANGASESTAGRREYEGVPVDYLPRTFPKRFFNSAGMSTRLEALLPSFDLLHIHGLWNMTVWKACSTARRHRKPYLISPRGMLDQGSMQRRSGLKRMMFPLVERKNLSEAAIIHATSEAEADAIKRFSFQTPVRLVPNGVDVVEPNRQGGIALRKTLGIVDTDPLAIYLGRIAPLKRLDLLAEAFKTVLSLLPAAKLIIAGPDEGNHLATLKPNFERLGKAIHVIGEVNAEQKRSLFAAADVLVCCSESESFGLSIAEALGAGVPAVATINSPWSVLEEVGAGKWVSHSKDGIVGGIVDVILASKESSRMSEAGRKLIQERFSWDGVAGNTIAMYEEVLASRRPAS